VVSVTPNDQDFTHLFKLFDYGLGVSSFQACDFGDALNAGP
jgi:hypothetical protein